MEDPELAKINKLRQIHFQVQSNTDYCINDTDDVENADDEPKKVKAIKEAERQEI